MVRQTLFRVIATGMGTTVTGFYTGKKNQPQLQIHGRVGIYSWGAGGVVRGQRVENHLGWGQLVLNLSLRDSCWRQATWSDITWAGEGVPDQTYRVITCPRWGALSRFLLRLDFTRKFTNEPTRLMSLTKDGSSRVSVSLPLIHRKKTHSSFLWTMLSLLSRLVAFCSLRTSWIIYWDLAVKDVCWMVLAVRHSKRGVAMKIKGKVSEASGQPSRFSDLTAKHL